MGAALGLDRIGNVSHSSGILTLGNPAGRLFSTITIGGQQYRTGVLSRAISSDVTLLAGSLYMVFAVSVGGAVQLRVSSNLNSIGPSGFTAWKLLGAFYANGLGPVGLGSFVNIDGVPSTEEWIDGGPIPISATTTPPTKGTTTRDKMWWLRDGGNSFIRYEYMGTSSGAANGVGDYLWGLPPDQLIDPNKVFFNNAQIGDSSQDFPATVGTCTAGHFTVTAGTGVVRPFNNSSVRLFVVQTGSSANNHRPIGQTVNWFLVGGAANVAYSADFRVPISGWFKTPLKDL